jgi:hypothetical protein
MIGGIQVSSIGDGAFAGCVQLTCVTLPEGLCHIGNKAFFGCDDLARVDMPASISSIGKFAFTNCPDVVLHVTSGGYADEYARRLGLKYEYAYAD